ncbi:MAG: periplasmic protein TonB [Sphingomonadales bacterium]|jgi:protein TonB|nr:periplasmic protein TonB [Sphingomonadales bacterium]
MAEAAFLEPRRIRPGAAAVVVLLHGTAITALLMAKGYVPAPPGFTRTEVTTVRLQPPPPPEPQPVRPREQRTVWTPTPTPPFRNPEAPTVPDRPVAPPDLGSLASSEDVRGVPETPPVTPSPPPAAPVRREAVLISGDLQPPYPTSEQRAQREGTVVVQVVVGADGRVIRVEKVRATSDAFFEATARHARSRWRFRPATVDGRPVEATKTLTVRFQLQDG